MKKSKSANEMAEMFAALADPTRLRLLNLMNGREVCVCHFAEFLKQNQPKISRHLAYLRNAGLVKARREGKWMHYSLVKPKNDAAAVVLARTLKTLSDDVEMQAEKRLLIEATCAPALVMLKR